MAELENRHYVKHAYYVLNSQMLKNSLALLKDKIRFRHEERTKD